MDAASIRQEAAAAAAAGESLKLISLARSYTVYLSPMFHLIPWDDRVLISEAKFARAYDYAAKATGNFSKVTEAAIVEALQSRPSTLTVFRIIAGYRVEELAHVLQFKLGAAVTKGTIKRLEMTEEPALPRQHLRIQALGKALWAAVQGTLLPHPPGTKGFVNRHDKFDTKGGWQDVAKAARLGVPYATALYERYLGRPFAYVVDALSSAKADLIEAPVQALLTQHGVPHYRSKAIDKIPRFEQAPDFLIPTRDQPQIVIEAKLAEDGGTARDKASRIERLARTTEREGMTLIAVVDGKGFFRINDVLAPILRVTKGLTFTLSTLPSMVELPIFKRYRKKVPS